MALALLGDSRLVFMILAFLSAVESQKTWQAKLTTRPVKPYPSRLDPRMDFLVSIMYLMMAVTFRCSPIIGESSTNIASVYDA